MGSTLICSGVALGVRITAKWERSFWNASLFDTYTSYTKEDRDSTACCAYLIFLHIGVSLSDSSVLIFPRAFRFVYIRRGTSPSSTPTLSPAIHLALSPSSGYISCRVVGDSKRLSLGMSDTFENVLHLFGSDLHIAYTQCVDVHARSCLSAAAAEAATTTGRCHRKDGRDINNLYPRRPGAAH